MWALVDAWSAECAAARAARRNGDPGSWTGRYPVGNTGGSDVSAFTVMPVPPDLQSILDLTRS